VVEDEIQHLRVLIANERRDRLETLAQVVAGLGHEVIAREVEVGEVGAVTARERPDVALVGLGLSSEHALELIAKIVHESACPVIALLSARDPAYVREAAKSGWLHSATVVEPQRDSQNRMARPAGQLRRAAPNRSLLDEAVRVARRVPAL
jgi:AmiR/NasT family two-component response regulator